MTNEASLIGLRLVLGIVEAGFFVSRDPRPASSSFLIVSVARYSPLHELLVQEDGTSPSLLHLLCRFSFGGSIRWSARWRYLDRLRQRERPACLEMAVLKCALIRFTALIAYIVAVEGLMTVAFAVIAIFILPDMPSNTKWLTEEERAYAVGRLVADHNADGDEDEKVGHWASIKMATLDWRTWLFCFGQSTCTAAGTITYFIPTLTSSLGYSGSEAQYVSVFLIQE